MTDVFDLVKYLDNFLLPHDSRYHGAHLGAFQLKNVQCLTYLYLIKLEFIHLHQRDQQVFKHYKIAFVEIFPSYFLFGILVLLISDTSDGQKRWGNPKSNQQASCYVLPNLQSNFVVLGHLCLALLSIASRYPLFDHQNIMFDHCNIITIKTGCLTIETL